MKALIYGLFAALLLSGCAQVSMTVQVREGETVMMNTNTDGSKTVSIITIK